jgi:hypothetical protein
MNKLRTDAGMLTRLRCAADAVGHAATEGFVDPDSG